MESQIVEQNFHLHKYQEEAYNAKNKFVAAIAGIQSGKTLCGAMWVAKKLVECDGHGVIIANDHKMLDQSTLQKLFEINPWLRPYYKMQRGIIELPEMEIGLPINGNMDDLEFRTYPARNIYIRSSERPESIEGFTADWAWLDEAGKYKVATWVNIQARVAIKRGQIFITTTPDAMNWLYYDFYERALKKDDDFLVVQWKSIDNPYFSEEEYERAKKTMSPSVFRMRYEGTFEQMEGLVYKLLPTNVIDPIKFTNVKDCIAGVDFGWTNPSAVSVIVMDGDGVYHVVDELYKEQMTTDELVEACVQLRDKWGITKFYPDPAEPDRIQVMKNAGLYTREVKKDIKQGVNDVQNLLFQNKLKVFKTCKHHIEEFNTYHYEEYSEDKNQKEKPVPFNDHLMDSLRYALTTYNYVAPRPRVNMYKPLNKRTGY